MPEWGFGSPSSIPGSSQTVHDWGFGSPTPALLDASRIDTGFGSPFGSEVAPQVDLADGQAIPDDGGTVINLTANWMEEGPYSVRLLDAESTLFPVATDCYSAVPGQGNVCYTDAAKGVLKFSTPRLPVGIYSIRLQWGAGNEVTLSNALTVVRRNRSINTVRIRTRYPKVYVTGPRSIRGEKVLT